MSLSVEDIKNEINQSIKYDKEYRNRWIEKFGEEDSLVKHQEGKIQAYKSILEYIENNKNIGGIENE